MKKKIVRKRKPKSLVTEYIQRRSRMQAGSRLEPLDRSAKTLVLEQIRDLELQLAALRPPGIAWPTPKFRYGQHVQLKPLDWIKGRVVDLHLFGMVGSVEYDVRYFHEGKEFKARVFEDELEVDDGQ